MTEGAQAPTLKRSLKKVMLGDAAAVVSASLATTKRLRSSSVADLPCQVCGKLSKSSVIARGSQPVGVLGGAPLDILSKISTGIAPRGGVVVCEACKKFCSRFAQKNGTNGESGEWMTKCGCRKLARTEDGTAFAFDQTSLIDRTLADMCRWCRFRRCHALGLVVDNEVKASLKGPIDLHSVPCAVCAAPSSGYHFGVISCEGCKGFYRRTIHHELESSYVCESNGPEQCDVTTQGGRRCKKCRFAKCTALGMSLAAIRTGRHSYQLRAETRAHLAQLQAGDNPASVAPAPVVSTSVTAKQEVITPSVSEASDQASEPSPIMGMALESGVDMYPEDDCQIVSDDDSSASDTGYQDPGKRQRMLTFAPAPSSSNDQIDVLSPPFTAVDSPADSEIFRPIDSGGDSPSLGSSGQGSPRNDTIQDAISKMRRPCEKSPYIWLYDSAREYVDLRQPNPRPSCGNSLSTHDKDPLHLLDDYFFVTPIVPENIVSTHLPMPDVSRAQWIIRRVVQSSRLIGNITTIRTIIRPDMNPVDVFSAMVGHFDTFSRFVLQFVKSLPGFDSVCLQDRTRLFVESMFPLLSAQLSLDYDEVAQMPNICGLEPGPGRQLAFNYFYHLGIMEPPMKDAGISMKQARLCVIEFSMICGLLYFNPDVPGLAEPHRVRRIYDEYQRAAEIFIGRNFHTNGSASASSRIQLFYTQLSYFRSFYRFFSWLLCDFGQHYPSLVGMDPWLSELHGRVSQLQSKDNTNGIPDVTPSPIIVAAAAAASAMPSSTTPPLRNPQAGNLLLSSSAAPSPLSYGLFS